MSRIIQLASLADVLNNKKSKRKNPSRYRLYSVNGLSPTICANSGGGLQPYIMDDFCNIRKLTPSEELRLMGMKDDNIKILTNGDLSDSRLYKLAGNSIVIPCLQMIFEKLLK